MNTGRSISAAASAAAAVSALLHVLLMTVPTASASAASKYTNCDASTYYSPTYLYDLAQVTSLLKSTHRDALPYTSTAPDVWDALIDLDSTDDTSSSVKLVYRSIAMPSLPHGETDTWNREHLWPKSHGVGYSGADYTDLHALRPADWNVNTARSNRFFATCGIANLEEECVRPANPEAAADTERDGTTFLPPANVRGDIARALFYMAARYDGTDPDTEDLHLSDCPDPADPSEMGYLSQLLTWHVSDPVDDAERVRNAKVCADWQGNRNPYVDYPELVAHHFGLPRNVPSVDGGGYDCAVPNPAGPPPPPTSAPTPAPVSATTSTTVTGGTCRGLTGGDVMVTGFRSDNPDSVVFVPLVDVPAGAGLYLTDNAWTGTEFKTNEGTKKLIVPAGGIPAGSVFSYESSASTDSLPHGDAWASEAGTFALSSASDSIFLYCLDDDDATGTPESVPVHLTAATYSGGGWSDPNGDSATFGTGESALPADLPSNAVLTLPHLDNYLYIGPRTGTRTELLDALSDGSSAWSGSNGASTLAVLDQAPFVIDQPAPAPTVAPTPAPVAPTPAPAAAPPQNDLGNCKGLIAGDVMLSGFNADDPDEVAMVALADLAEGAEIYVTDSAWTGAAFKSSEGVKKLAVPIGGIARGTVFGYSRDGTAADFPHADSWESERGSFLLSSAADAIFLYCLGTDGSTPVHLSGLSYSSTGWVPVSSDESTYTSGVSSLPAALPANCAVELPHKDNYVYMGSRSGSKEDILNEMSDANHWLGSDGERHELGFVLGEFILTR